MSAAADTTALSGGGNNVSVDGSRLEQPTDAVPMKSIAQSQEDGSPTNDDNQATSKATTEPVSSGADETPAKSEEADDTVGTPASKGKEAAARPVKDRQDSMAIGPAQDEIKAVSAGATDGPVCNITLLLTTGSRHPYKIDRKYLAKRNVAVPEETESGQPDPFSISIYTLKELILREWRADWEAKPASPSSIRLIHFGKLLDDNAPLKSTWYHKHTNVETTY